MDLPLSIRLYLLIADATSEVDSGSCGRDEASSRYKEDDLLREGQEGEEGDR